MDKIRRIISRVRRDESDALPGPIALAGLVISAIGLLGYLILGLGLGLPATDAEGTEPPAAPDTAPYEGTRYDRIVIDREAQSVTIYPEDGGNPVEIPIVTGARIEIN